MRTQYIDPIENFPNQIDRLLDALNRVLFHSLYYKFEISVYLDYMSQRTNRL
jgi:hypothetical protein